jgi:imidazolonepropionase
MNEEITLLLTNASQLLTLGGLETPRVSSAMRELGIIEGGSVVVSGSKIADVGTEKELRERYNVSDSVRTIDCSGKVVAPGFVDPHTHPVFEGFRLDEYEMRTAGMSYQEIASKGGGIVSSMKGVRNTSEEELLSIALQRLDGFLQHGTTTIEAKSGYGLSLEDELKLLRVISRLEALHPLEVIPTFLGAHAIPPEFSGERREYLDIIIGDMLPKVAEEKLAHFCDIFVEIGYFTIDEGRELLTAAQKVGLKGRVHADELSSSGGAELAAEVGAVSADHLVYITEDGMKAMAEKGLIATLLPGTTFFLGLESYAPAREIIDHDVPVALATDFNPGSCTTQNMQSVLTIAVTQMGVSPAEALTAVTINAACALCMEDVIGSIERGKKADLAIFDVTDYREIPYIFGRNHCGIVIKRGRVVVEGGHD